MRLISNTLCKPECLLQQLTVDNVDLGFRSYLQSDFDKLNKNLENLPKSNLRYLSLQDCRLEPDSLRSLGVGLVQNQKLETLLLKGNTVHHSPDFCHNVSQAKALSKLDLSSTYL